MWKHVFDVCMYLCLMYRNLMMPVVFLAFYPYVIYIYRWICVCTYLIWCMYLCVRYRTLMMSFVYLVGVLCIDIIYIHRWICLIPVIHVMYKHGWMCVCTYLLYVCMYLCVIYRRLMMSVVYLVGVSCSSIVYTERHM